MSNTDAPDVGSGETNIPDLLSEQSGTPNMSSSKTFTVDTNMQVNGDLDVTGTVTATSFIGDGSQLTGISGGSGGGLDSAAVTLLVDSDYVQARETPQDFAYSSLTGAPTALSSFTNDTSYITAADIPTTVDSDYVAARSPTGGGGLDSAGVTALIDEPYVRDVLYNAKAQTNVGLDAGFASTSNFSIAIGRESGINSGNATNSIAIGFKAGQNIHDNSIMIGRETAEFSPVSYAVGIGTEALQNTAGNSSVAVGYRAGQTNSGGSSVSIGRESKGSGANSIAIGSSVTATSSNATSIGFGSDVTNFNSTALGYNAQVSGSEAVALGSGSNSVGNASVAIGYNAKTGGSSQIAIGDGAGSTTDASSHAVMIGPNAGALCGQFSSALGYFAQASGGNAVAIGARTRADGLNSIQISATGVQRIISTQYEIDIRTSAAGSLTYDTTNDWTFGAGVTMTDLTASGATVVFSNLPTTDPVNAGQLWNDAGTLKVSAG